MKHKLAVALVAVTVMLGIASYIRVARGPDQGKKVLREIRSGMRREDVVRVLAKENLRLNYYGSLSGGMPTEDRSCGFYYFEGGRLGGFIRHVLVVRFDKDIVTNAELKRIGEKENACR